MRLLHLILFFLLSNALLLSQKSEANITKYDLPFAFDKQQEISDVARFGLTADHSLRLQYEHTTSNGRRHLKYHQYFQGQRVLNGTFIFHLNAAGEVTTTSGHLAQIDELDLKPTYPSYASEQRAVDVVMSHQAATAGLQLTAQDLVVSNTQGVIAPRAYPQNAGGYVPAYRHTVQSAEDHLHPVSMEVVINARSGQLIAIVSNIHAASVIGTGEGLQNHGISFVTDSVGENHYEMYDDTRGQGVWAYDMLYERRPFDEDNVWDDPSESAGAMVDGYYASQRFYDFLLQKFNRNSLDGEGVPLISNFNRNNFVNAFWNGESATYGNGNCDSYGPLTSVDVVGHEFAHGLTQYTSDLIYQDESGALNESISDILGKALEFEVLPDAFDWNIGSAFRRSEDVNFFRSMSNPNQRNHPKYYLGRHWRTGPADAGGVHSNSGVLNFWFYLLVEGDRSVSENGDRYDVSPIGWQEALNLIYLMETGYLIESSGYPEAYELSMLAAEELFGTESDAYDSVQEAWKAIGFPLEPDSSGDDPVSLDFFANYNNPGTSFDFRFCPEELLGLTISFVNESDTTIVSGSMVSGYTVFTYFGDQGLVEDTVRIEEQAVAFDLEPGAAIQLPVPYVAPLDNDFISVDSELSFLTPEETVYEVSTSGFLFINVLEEITLNFFNADYGAICGAEQIVEDDFYSVTLPRCLGETMGSIRIIYESPDDMVFLEQSIDGPGTAAISFFDTFADADAASLGDLNRVTFRIVHLADDVETVIYEEALASRFASSFATPKIIDFADSLEAEYELAIQTGAFITAAYQEEYLHLNSVEELATIQECVLLRDWLRAGIQAESQQITALTFCVDGSDITNPYLTFDLQMMDNPEYNSEENDYLHLATIFADSSEILDDPISTTGGEWQNFEVALGEDFIGEVTIFLGLMTTTANLDNLGIRSGSATSTRQLDTGNYGITYNNPANDLLEIRSVTQLPRGSIASLYSGAGQLLQQQVVSTNQTDMRMEQLPSGLYYLTITDGETFRWTGKVVRMK